MIIIITITTYHRLHHKRDTQSAYVGSIPSIFSQALVVEAIHLRDLSTFVVASDECDAVRIAHLQAQPAMKHEIDVQISQ